MLARILISPVYLLKSILGLASVVWAIAVIPVSWSQSVVMDVAYRINSGEFYESELLKTFAAKTKGTPAGANSAATAVGLAAMRRRLAENEIASSDQPAIDAGLNAFQDAIKDALSRAPSDAALWLDLFWLDKSRSNVTPARFDRLRMSYLLGPEEGFLFVRRSRLALASFLELPPDVAEMAVTEFIGLIRLRLLDDAAAMIADPEFPLRKILLARLDSLEQPVRGSLAKLLNPEN